VINKIVDWRSWRLPVKLAAVLVVPVAAALGSGVLHIQGYVERADSYASMRHVVELRAELMPVLSGVQQERTIVARGADATAFGDQVKATDATLRRTVEHADGVGAAALVEASERLAGLRDRVVAGTVDAATSTSDYTAVVNGLIDFDGVLAARFRNAAVSGTATAAHGITHTQEQVRYEQAVVLAGMARGQLLDTEVKSLGASLGRREYTAAEFGSLVDPAQLEAYRQRVTGPDVEAYQRLLQVALTHPVWTEKLPAAGARRREVLPIDPDEWNRSAENMAAALGDVRTGLLDDLGSATDRLQDDASDKAGTATAVLLATLIVATSIGFVVGRQLLRSLNALRRAALDVAQHRLPEVVAIGLGERRPTPKIEPVPVHTTEEFGQLARAFDAVHEQAVRAAVDQAGMRGTMRDIFVNLSRRSQGLVERQLKLMEELEKYEEDPEQLANLFKLDHLATRMRRNNENLMVLSGSQVARRFSRPVPLADVLRAGASEIEQYQRVEVRSAPPVEVLGYAASDLVRLVAELLDNATAFSPPSTQVVISARAREDGPVQIDITDRGIGMADRELAAANKRLTAEGADLPVFQEMGLFVVGKLAARHGIAVRLQAAEHHDGLRASVVVPAGLVHGTTVPDHLDDHGWTSFRGKAVEEVPPQAPRRADPVPSGGIAGLPKRMPQTTSGAATAGPPAPTSATARRTPEQARGFLAGYQRGVWDGERAGIQDWQENR
jgi:signal transduction histidine kinase